MAHASWYPSIAASIALMRQSDVCELAKVGIHATEQAALDKVVDAVEHA